jgi:topoisomerase-4 subunit A
VGKRKMLLRSEELQKFRADRGRRGTLLPRGLQKIDRVELDAPARPASPDSEA